MDKIKEIRDLHNQGLSVRDIANQTGLSKSTVARKIQDIPKVTRSFLNPQWTTLRGGETGPVDSFGAVPEPDIATLLGLYEDTVYSCAKWLSDTVSSVPLKVYAKTYPNQKAPRCPHRIIKSSHLGEFAHLHLAEVLEHPFKSLIDAPNPDINRSELLRLIDLDLSLCGNSWVHKVRADDGLPEALYPLMPDKMSFAYDSKGHHIGWSYSPRTTEVFLPKADVIWFKMIDPRNRDGLGYSPVRGVYERVLLSKNEMAYLASLFRNQARPDSMVSVKGILADEAERLQKEWNMRFKQGGTGGVVVVDGEEVSMEPLSWNPKDILGTELYKWIKLQIINAFGLNPAIFDTESANRAIADTARYMAVLNGVVPRLRGIEEKLNQCLASEFDPRLLVAFENPVPEDRAERLQIYASASAGGAVTRQDWRDFLGLPEKDWAAEPLLPSGVMPIDAFDQPRNDQAEETPAAAPAQPEATAAPAATDNVQDTALNGAQIASLLQIIEQVTQGLLPKEAAKHVMRVSFPAMPQSAIDAIVNALEVKPAEQPPAEQPKTVKSLGAIPSEKPLVATLQRYFEQQEKAALGNVKSFLDPAAWNADLAERLKPVMRAYWDHGTASLVSQVGLTPDILKVVNPRVADALTAWTMKLAESTNATTDKELTVAHQELKDKLEQGIMNGEEYQQALTQRVKQVFERASTERAFLIAKTESVRAINTAQLMTAEAAEDNGIKLRKSLILNYDACEECKAIKDRFPSPVEIKTVFNSADTYGDGSPPFHPSCFCVVKYTLEE